MNEKIITNFKLIFFAYLDLHIGLKFILYTYESNHFAFCLPESSVGHETVSAFILTAKSDNLIIKTAKPPDPPSNLGVLATTCNAIKLAWYQPIEHGIDVMCKYCGFFTAEEKWSKILFWL